jgi:glycosyltransferase 2 family protein
VVTVAPVQTTSGRGVVVVEPRLPRRVRRPSDLLRLVGSLVLLAVPLVLGTVAVSTSTGLEQDLFNSINSIRGLTKVVLLLGTWAAGIGLLAVPVGLALDLIVRRRIWQLLDALVAATVAIGVSFLLRYWIVHAQPGRVLETLTKVVDSATGERTQPIQGLLVAIVAFLTLAGLSGRRVWRLAATVSIGAVSLFGFLSGHVTALSTVVSLLLGWSIGLSVRYVLGAASTRPSGTEIADALVAANTPIERLERVDEHSMETRRYLGHQPGGGLLRVEVLDRDTYGQALISRLWRRLQLRGPATRRSFLTVRSAIDHEALMALSAHRAGVPAPELVAVTEVGAYAACLAFRNLPGRTVHDAVAAGDELDDDQLRVIWQNLRRLQRQRVAHRALTADNILLTDDDEVALLDLSAGEIAASDVAMRLDVVQLLTTLGLVAGAEPAVRTAVDVLGPNPVVDALPLLQRIALARSTRQELKEHRGLLHDLRAQIIAVTPADPDVEEIQLQRLSARTVVAVVGGAVAAYVLVTRLPQVNFRSLASVNWYWAAAAMVCSCLTYLAAGMTCAGFVLARVSLWRATLTQYAVGFSGLLAPTAVGTVALNVRFLERSGVDPAVAVSSVGLVQLVMFVGHILLLLLFGVLAGTGKEASFTPPQGAVIAVLVLVILALVGLSLPIGRRLIAQRVRPMVRRVVPQLFGVFQKPGKLAMGLGGALLLNVAYILALDASCRGFDAHLPFATVAVVYLAGSVVGSAIPTPGGIGAIELAMASGLTAAGLPAGVAFPAVLLYRITTFWIPIPVGWLSLAWLQRVGSL